MQDRTLILGLVPIIIAVGCGVPQEKYDADIAALTNEVSQARSRLEDAKKYLSDLQNEKRYLEAQLAGLQSEIDRLSGESSANARLVAQAKKRLETFQNMLKHFKDMMESGKLKIKIVDNKMVVEMDSAILFPTGTAELSDEGQAALTEVAGILATISDRNFQVAGHTDNVPIKNRKFKSNWDLSSARAIAVVKHLIENGVLATHLSGAGYADTQPAASNDNEAGKAQNRRIEIVLQPKFDELPDLSSLVTMLK